MKQELLERIKSFLNCESNSGLRGKPARDEEILLAERELDISFHADYKDFIKQFGGAYVGIEVRGFSNGDWIGKEIVTELTKRMRFDFKPFFPEIDQCYVIAIDGFGNPIAQTKSGQVVLFDHDTGVVEIMSESFETLIEKYFDE